MVDRKAGRIHEFRAALRSSDPYALANVLVLPPIAVKKPDDANNNNNNNNNSKRSVEALQENGTDWSPVLNAYLDACQAADTGDAVKCYERQAAVHTAFHDVFGNSAGNVLVPALLTVCRMTHRTAVLADIAAGQHHEHIKLQNAATLLQESFSRTYNDRREYTNAHVGTFDADGSKKAGVLRIVNELFAIYFRLNTLRLCKNLLRPVEGRKLHELGVMGQMVTYRYYVGRLKLFEDQYADAEENLEYAFRHCHRNSVHNKTCILRYLVPVKLFRGRLPTSELLEKYQLPEFVSLVAGIRQGDLRTFNAGLIDFQHRFICQGTYLLLEKCKTVCYRNLFKRIHSILDKPQIPLNYAATAFKWLGVPIDMDEIECILANLIYRGYIRGYLSHAKRVLVLSKRDPFPAASLIAK